MRPDDFLYGARSGIQKAIRRGDLPLAKLCFDALWANKTQRAWLKWRTVAIVQEEVSYYLGELAEFLEKKSDSEKDWRRIFYEVTLVPKQKDGFALMSLGKSQNKFSHRELKMVRPWFRDNHDVDPSSILSEVKKDVMNQREFSSYEERAIEMLASRVGMGGMLGDRQACLTNMAFIAFRPLIKKDVRSRVDASVEVYLTKYGASIKSIPENTLPWYVMDMHTVVGKTSMKIFMKRYAKGLGIDNEYLLRRLWFLMSSGFVPKTMMNYSEICEKPSPYMCIWEIPHIKYSVPKIGKRSPAEMRRWWNEVVAPKMKGIVEWLIARRSNE